MTIQAADLKYYQSLDNDSLGGDISGDVVPVGLDLFYDAIPQGEAISGSVSYRCIYVKNESPDALVAANIYVHGLTPSPSTHIELGLGTAGTNLAEQSISGEEIAPIGVIFTTPVQANPLALPSLTSGDYHAVWMKRVTDANAVGALNDNVVLGFSGDQTPP